MKRIAIYSLVLLLAGCCTLRRSTSSETHTASSTVSDRAHYESLYYELRDSLVRIKAPTERSETRGLQRSDLETSLARSSASVDSAGVLSHSIENKDSIPSKIVYRNINRTIHDTVKVFHSDTVRVKDYQYVEKQPGLWQRLQMRGFWLLLCVLAVIVVVVVGKKYIKRFI